MATDILTKLGKLSKRIITGKILTQTQPMGIIHCTDKRWRMKNIKHQGLLDAIGQEITLWYE